MLGARGALGTLGMLGVLGATGTLGAAMQLCAGKRCKPPGARQVRVVRPALGPALPVCGEHLRLSSAHADWLRP